MVSSKLQKGFSGFSYYEIDKTYRSKKVSWWLYSSTTKIFLSLQIFAAYINTINNSGGLFTADNNNMNESENAYFKDSFLGSNLDVKWSARGFLGVGKFVLTDTIGGQLEITCEDFPNAKSQIDFDNVKNYSAIGSVIKTNIKKTSHEANVEIGFENDFNDSEKKMIAMASAASGGVISLCSANDVKSYLGTDVAVHTNYQEVKIETFKDKINMHLDGSLKATKTTDLPSLIQQPFLSVSTPDTIEKKLRIKYVEVYNT